MDYKEKVRLAKEALESGSYDKETIEYIFPELKESEDEKMIQYFKDLAPFDKADELYEKYGFSHKDAIAWLEKQGGHAKFINGIQVGDKVTRNEDGVLVNLSQLNRVAKKDEKQRKNNMGISEATKQKLEDNLNKALEKETTESWNKFLDEQGEQKSADKIESRQEELTEFEKAVKQVMKEAIECGDTHNLKADADMLLRLVQKSWSEEDEEQLDRALYMMEQLDMTKSWDDVYNWLKSLKERYTWKPSDEQMLAINTAINVLGKGTINGKYLIELQEQLKKLMDEDV